MILDCKLPHLVKGVLPDELVVDFEVADHIVS